MSREWKPGDVAVHKDGRRMFRHGKRFVLAEPGFNGAYIAGPVEHDLRPLLVIDPEDRGQVERLCLVRWEVVADHDVDHMQAALRSLITPPNPPEPTGWGAVVEDDTGAYWTLIAARSSAWRNYAEGARTYDQIAVVRIVSEGVPQ